MKTEIKAENGKKYINIRTARPEDATELLNIYKHYVTDTAITFEYDVPSLKEFSRRIKNTLQKYPYLLAEDENRILGYAYAGTFKGRAAYNWAVEMSIYLEKSVTHHGLGKALYGELEKILQRMNVTNVNACITYPNKTSDEFIDTNSYEFHKALGYRLVGEFHECGYKFGRWYDMIWMEKMISEHKRPQPDFIPFPEL